MDDHLLARIRAEYIAMPGLHLTLPQARRLWHSDELSCRAALDELVRAHFLVQRADGSFSRAFDSPRLAAPKARMAKAPAIDDRLHRHARQR